MQIKLSDLFSATLCAAIWAMTWQTNIPLPTWIAASFTILAVYRISWLSLIAFVGSLESWLQLHTCACWHIESWIALCLTPAFSIVGWYAVWQSVRVSVPRKVVAIAISLVATCVFLKNVQDLLFLGHSALWPDTAYFRMGFSNVIMKVLMYSFCVCTVLPLLVGVYRFAKWIRSRCIGDNVAAA